MLGLGRMKDQDLIEAILRLCLQREGEGALTLCDLERMELHLLRAIAGCRCSSGLSYPSHRPVRFRFGVGPFTQKTKKAPHMDITITNEQKVSVTLTPVTDAGKPAKLDGAPAWTVLSGSSMITVATDGLSAVLTSADDPGTTEIQVSADADLGEGVQEISATISLIVVHANASNLGLVVGTPEPK